MSAQAVPTDAAPTPATAPARNQSVDLLRGLVMVVMVLDHARDFFNGARFRPTDMATTTPIFFFTRWITHFCAPVFVFLAGTAAFFYGRKHTRAELARFLVTRGLWLVLLEITVVRMGWVPDPGYHYTLLQVIWAIGWSMVFLALVSLLPVPLIAAIGVALMAGHNALDGVHAADFGSLGWLWNVLHEPHMAVPAAGHHVMLAYPLLPWFGVIAAGFALGRVFTLPAERRRPLLLWLGLGLCAAFVVLRTVNGYGDPEPWQLQPTRALSVASFLNCQKYPPSLDYLLMTLGPALLLLLAFERAPDAAPTRVLSVFGRVPLFFYVAHLYLLRYLSIPLAYRRWGLAGFAPPPGHAGSPEYPLWVTYLVWLLAIAALYPLCRWYAGVKQRGRGWWWSYL